MISVHSTRIHNRLLFTMGGRQLYMGKEKIKFANTFLQVHITFNERGKFPSYSHPLCGRPCHQLRNKLFILVLIVYYYQIHWLTVNYYLSFLDHLVWACSQLRKTNLNDYIYNHKRYNASPDLLQWITHLLQIRYRSMWRLFL